MKKNSLLQTSTLWINILLLVFFLTPAHASPDNTRGFHLDDGIYKSSFKFRSVNNLIIMPVVIDGQKLNLIFDTGMNSIILFNKKSIKSWKKKEKHVIHFSGLGKGQIIKGYRVDEINVEMPKIKGKGLSLVVTPYSSFPRTMEDINIHGIFGYQLLTKFIVQIDYKRQLITLTDPHHFVPPFDSSVIDLKIFNTKPYINCPVVVDQKEHNLNLLVDTGAEISLILDKKAIPTVKVSGYKQVIGVGLAGKLTGNKIMVNHLKLGTYHISKDFRAWVPTQKSYPNESKKLIRDGTIGGETLKQFVVTFDYFNNKLYLESNSPKLTYNKLN
jgi:hypothetical protein